MDSDLSDPVSYWAESIVSRNLLLLPHNTSGGGGPSRYDGAPVSPLRKNVCLLFHHSPGPQENKPISCHCDRIKMEPSYFSNTMQARREREGQWVREKEIQHHLPIKPMNYGAASFSRKDYKLILSPRDNYSKVQLLTSVAVWPRTTGSDTHPFYTFIFWLQHSKSAWWQWFISRRLLLGSTAILLPRAAVGSWSHEPPWA